MRIAHVLACARCGGGAPSLPMSDLTKCACCCSERRSREVRSEPSARSSVITALRSDTAAEPPPKWSSSV
eukprot:4560518-Pleurochrysis_carterae.AAC.1